MDFGQLYLNLGDQTYDTLEAAEKAGAPLVKYGAFINATIDFVIIAFVIFLAIKAINKLKRKEEEALPNPQPIRKTWCCCVRSATRSSNADEKKRAGRRQFSLAEVRESFPSGRGLVIELLEPAAVVAGGTRRNPLSGRRLSLLRTTLTWVSTVRVARLAVRPHPPRACARATAGARYCGTGTPTGRIPLSVSSTGSPSTVTCLWLRSKTWADLERGALRTRAGPTHHRLDSRHRLEAAHRLDEIVVGAIVERLDDVAFGVACGHEDYRVSFERSSL